MVRTGILLSRSKRIRSAGSCHLISQHVMVITSKHPVVGQEKGSGARSRSPPLLGGGSLLYSKLCLIGLYTVNRMCFSKQFQT